jgi:nucleotide-binding universal stress UspA family protein
MGTIVCGVEDTPEAVEALRVAAVLSRQLGLRLVLAHVVRGYEPTGGPARREAEALLERVAGMHGLERDADRRAELGEPAETLSRIAAEEGATLIVLGTARRRRGRPVRSGLADELAGAATCPVVVVPCTPRR